MMKQRIPQSILAGLMVLSMVLSMVVPVAAAPLAAAPVQQPFPPVSPQPDDRVADAAGSLRATTGAKTGRLPNQPTPRVLDETDPGGTTPAVYIVQLEDAPLASYRGGANDLAATSPAVTGAALDVQSSAAQGYLGYLDTRQGSVLDGIQRALNRSVEVRFRYQVAFNGFALVLTPVEAAQIARLEGVQRVQREWMAQPQTDVGPAWVGAGNVWGGTPGTQGEGIVAGILDTGINMVNPSFARTGGDGYVHSNPRGKYYGVCDPESEVYDANFTCNDKLIGAWDFADGLGTPGNDELDGPEDNDGHGSHTASTVAGNYVNANVVTETYVFSRRISGMAPHANIIAYDVCLPVGCPGAALVAGLNQAVADGVDVINFSIGGGSRNPWQSADALAMLAAYDAGVYVAVSAGNSGPDAMTIGSPSNAPWVTSVAASTHDRYLGNGLINMTGGNQAAPADMAGRSLTGPLAPAPIVYAGNYTSTAKANDGLCLGAFAPGTFNGEIVVCDRGINGRVAKGNNVAAGGAGGYVLVNDEDNGDSLSADAYALPGVHLSYADGVTLKAWIAAGGVTTATIQGTTALTGTAYADIMAGFSSRGPDLSQPGVLKPDVAAPGVDIMAAYHRGVEFNIISGTSMASPHTAGAGALLSALFPTWTPGMIRSALMLTARPAMLKEDGTTAADPFDMGAGRIQVDKAAAAGFVLDETTNAYASADPSLGGDPRTLNIASLADQQCIGVCTWIRTLTSVSEADESYTVSTTAPVSMTLIVEPASFTLAAGGTQVVTITADVASAALDRWIFGQVHFEAASPAISAAQMPVAAFTRAGGAPLGVHDVTIDTRRNQGSSMLEGIRAIGSASLVKAVYLGEEEMISTMIAQDPTNSDPYDIGAGGVFTALVPITSTQTARLGIAIADTTSVDADLYVGFDANGDGQPSPDEELCMSATAAALEQCAIDAPEVGNYWMLVQNWEGSAAAEDDFMLSVTRVSRGTPSSEITVTGPDSSTEGTPFDLQVNWNLPALAAGQTILGLLEVGTDSSDPDNILSLPFTLNRLGDDVELLSEADFFPEAYFQRGDFVIYGLLVEPEPTLSGQVQYVINTTLPAGLSYVPGSAPIEPIVNGNTLQWTLDLSASPQYQMSTNRESDGDLYDPACDTLFGGYTPLAAFGIPAEPDITGNGKAWNIDTFYGGADPWNLFGKDYAGMSLTDDGVLSPLGFDPALTSGVNAPIPTAAPPNALVAPAWSDFEVNYDAEAETGVRIAGAFGGALMAIEYDDLQARGAPENTLDMQAWILRQPSADDYEIVFAYADINGTLPATVTGLENGDGSVGVSFPGTLEDGLVICYDWAAAGATILFEAQVNDDAPLDTEQTATATHTLNQPGTGTGVSETSLFISGVSLAAELDAPALVIAGAPITYTLTLTNNGANPANNVQIMAFIPFGAQHVSGGTVQGEVVEFVIESLGAGASTQVAYSVEPIAYQAPQPTSAEAVGAAGAVQPAIIGGQPADPGEYPWQVALINRGSNTWWGCGGSLIAPTWVATAAHCVASPGEAPVDPANLSVALGRYSLSTSDGQQIPVVEVRSHEGFSNNFNNDIALLRLAEPAQLTTTVQTIPMVTGYLAHLYAAGVPATVTGWGTRTEGQPDTPDVLYEVQVPIVDQNTCTYAYDAIGKEVTDNMLCAGLPQGGKDTCQGDSGGPLVVADGDGYKLAGIVSWGEGCAAPALPGVYTRLANYTGWMATEMATLRARGFLISDGTGMPGHYVVDESQAATTMEGQNTILPMVFGE